MRELLEQFKRARKVSVPLLAIETPDPAATIAAIAQADFAEDDVLLVWDCVRGISGTNKKGVEFLKTLGKGDELGPYINPVECLMRAVVKFPKDTYLFMHNAQRILDDQGVAQAAWNVRDAFKENHRMVIFLGPILKFPAELDRDVIVLDEPLPDDEARGAIIKGILQAAKLKEPPKDDMTKTIEACRGLAAFSTEQVIAMSLSRDGIKLDEVWERKRKIIENVKGLTFFQSDVTFDDIGGHDNLKSFMHRIFKGRKPPTCIVFMDEIEKSMEGSTGGDLSGTSADQLGVILAAMQNNRWTGQLGAGPPGSGKSEVAKACAKTFGIPCIVWDLGAAKGSLVGESEMRIRLAVKTLLSIAGDGAYFMATCNRLTALPPELQRRFTDGVWYYDLPDESERKAIWNIHLKRYELDGKKLARPDDANWVGSDIHNTCSKAWRMNCDLVDAAKYIAPVFKTNPQAIEKLRAMADGVFLSTSYEGTYQKDRQPETKRGGRAVSA